MSIPLPETATGGVAAFGRALRAGRFTVESAISGYLERIDALNPRLGAYVHVDADGAVATARELDRRLAAGDDPGPLAGLSVAVKDVIAVDGMPVRAGSRIEVGDLIGREGAFVRRLRRAGCVILGKTATVEFALGAGPHGPGTPRNPHDPAVHRLPGGSSSGSAVAVAAGLCAFALGTDTGGSVRIPAALCGVAGLKTSRGSWPLDGVLPAAPSFDTLGLLTATATDAAFVHAALQDESAPGPADPAGLVLGRPRGFFSDHVAPEVEDCIEAALARAAGRGAAIRDIDFPEAAAARAYAPVVPAEFLARLTPKRFAAIRDDIDPDVAERIASALDLPDGRYRELMDALPELRTSAAGRFEGIDAIVTPTAPMVAPPIDRFADRAFATGYHRGITDKTRAASVLDLCAVTVPVSEPVAGLPAGLQVMCRRGDDARALAIARMLETCVQRPAIDLPSNSLH